MGSAGQPAESGFDFGTDTDASSHDEAADFDVRICLPTARKSNKRTPMAEVHEETSPEIRRIARRVLRKEKAKVEVKVQ
eukprot:1836655-Pyramimonas_sp.AAC.1